MTINFARESAYKDRDDATVSVSFNNHTGKQILCGWLVKLGNGKILYVYSFIFIFKKFCCQYCSQNYYSYDVMKHHFNLVYIIFYFIDFIKFDLYSSFLHNYVLFSFFVHLYQYIKLECGMLIGSVDTLC